MQIRPFQFTDQSAVIHLWKQVFPNSPHWNIPEEDIQRKQLVQPELFFVAEEKSSLIGTAMGGFDGHRGWVYYVAVLPEFRRKGIGSRLMAQVESGLIQAGCTKLNLQVRAGNEQVLSFYQRLGYLVEERVSLAKRLSTDTAD